jgi:hypothetical protein
MRLGHSFYPVPELIMNTSNHVGFISHSGHRRIVRNFNPLFVCLYFCCGLGSLTAWAAQEPKPLELIASGDRRQLSPGIFGASADPFYENLIGNAAKTAADAITAPALNSSENCPAKKSGSRNGTRGEVAPVRMWSTW